MPLQLFAISDIHGCSRTFQALLSRLNLNKKDCIVLLGDYLNREPASQQVLDCIFDLNKHYRVTALRGNHEDMIIENLCFEEWDKTPINSLDGLIMQQYYQMGQNYIHWLKVLQSDYAYHEFYFQHCLD